MAFLSETKTKKDRRVDQEDAKELSNQITRIESLSKDLQLSLSLVNRPHSAYGVLLVELDWLAIQLSEIKKRLK